MSSLSEAARLRLIRLQLELPLEYGEHCAAHFCNVWHGRPRSRGRVVRLFRAWVESRLLGSAVVPLCAFHLRRHLARVSKEKDLHK